MFLTTAAWVCVLFTTLVLYGCATAPGSAGDHPQAKPQRTGVMSAPVSGVSGVVAQIKKGVSTKDDVLGLLGPPEEIETTQDDPDWPEGWQAWFYYPKVTTRYARAITVVIDQKGIVQAVAEEEFRQ